MWKGSKEVAEFVALLGKVVQTTCVCSQDHECVILGEHQEVREEDRSCCRGLGPR